MKQKGWKYRQRFEILTIVLQLCDKQRIQNPLQFAHEKSSNGDQCLVDSLRVPQLS